MESIVFDNKYSCLWNEGKRTVIACDSLISTAGLCRRTLLACVGRSPSPPQLKTRENKPGESAYFI